MLVCSYPRIFVFATASENWNTLRMELYIAPAWSATNASGLKIIPMAALIFFQNNESVASSSFCKEKNTYQKRTRRHGDEDTETKTRRRRHGDEDTETKTRRRRHGDEDDTVTYRDEHLRQHDRPLREWMLRHEVERLPLALLQVLVRDIELYTHPTPNSDSFGDVDQSLSLKRASM